MKPLTTSFSSFPSSPSSPSSPSATSKDNACSSCRKQATAGRPVASSTTNVSRVPRRTAFAGKAHPSVFAPISLTRAGRTMGMIGNRRFIAMRLKVTGRTMGRRTTKRAAREMIKDAARGTIKIATRLVTPGQGKARVADGFGGCLVGELVYWDGS